MRSTIRKENVTLKRAMAARTMEPFYFLKCEHQDNRPSFTFPSGFSTGCNNKAIFRSSCTVRVFGKTDEGATVAVEMFNYLPEFYVSFRDRTVCVRVLNVLLKRIRGMSLTDTLNNEQPSYIKGIETATGFSSLIINKDHQNRNVFSPGHEYGDTSLLYTYRVLVRCFNHVRPAIREILEAAKVTDAVAGGKPSCDIRFYQSSLEPDVLIAETLKLRPCGWTLFDSSVCKKTSFGGLYGHLGLSTAVMCQTYSYDFEEHVDQNARVLGRVLYVKTPFPSISQKELPPPPPPPPPPPVSVLSFDIECLANDVNVFPTPDVCPIIQIATVVVRDALDRQHSNTYSGGRRRCLYTLHKCEPLYNDDNKDECVVVRCFEEERDMLAAFCADLTAEDPDIITGYYIENFDLPFLFARFQHYGLRPLFGRLGLVSTCVKNERRTTNANTNRKFTSHVTKSHFTTIHGRTIFDACVYVRKEFTMRSYTLNAVAERFLGARKDDVHYTQIPSLFLSGPQGRAVLGRYCVKDAQLVVDLLFNRRAFTNTFERCKVFNTQLGFMLDRGQQVRIASMLLKWCAAQSILIDDCTVAYCNNTTTNSTTFSTGEKRPATSKDSVSTVQEGIYEENENCGSGEDTDTAAVKDGGGKMKHTRYDGAVVIEPKTGLYQDPVICLDYASLYPSIMIAYNLCYSTMITNIKQGAMLVAKGDAVRTPVGHYFLNAKSKKGVLPFILETLILTRSTVRDHMTGLDRLSVEYALLDGQQHALKIAANSVYGATGCREGKLFFLHIPSSVTAYGRELIATTKQYVESEYAGRGEVIYGDTDSVHTRILNFQITQSNLWECADIGKEMADAVTRLINKPPIRLQFETVYMPFLLVSKKRYAAGIYKSLDHVKNVALTEGVEAASAALAAAGREVCCKGLEVVRRDNCLFAKNALQKAINMMIVDMESPERVVEEMRDQLAQLLNGKVNVRDLIVSKEWSKKTKNPTPHDWLAHKMAERNPGEAPKIGDRIQYVVLAQEHGRGESVKKLFERVEDPLYAVEHGLTLDYVYYANNQLLNPLTNLLTVVMSERNGNGGIEKEKIKNMLWPNVVAADGKLIIRPGKRESAGTVKRPRRNTKFDKPPPKNAKITSFIKRCLVTKTQLPKTLPLPANNNGNTLKDIEDICVKLIAECTVCKSGDVARVTTCKNRDCSTLYDRYEQKRKIKANGIRDLVKNDILNKLGF